MEFEVSGNMKLLEGKKKRVMLLRAVRKELEMNGSDLIEL